MSASPYTRLYCTFSNNSQNCIQKHLKHRIQRHADKSSAAMNPRALLRSVTCVTVISITISIKAKRKPNPAEGKLSPPGRTPIAQSSSPLLTGQILISPPPCKPAALCAKSHPLQILARMPYFTTTVNTSSIMGTKSYFLLVLPLSEDDIIPLPGPPMSAAAVVPGGCSQLCAALPARAAPGGGKT